MHTMKPVEELATELDALVASGLEKPLGLMSTITFNPFHGVHSEEYSDSSVEQRAIYLRNKCKEAEIVILTLSKMFEGEIVAIPVPELNLSVGCILRTHKRLTPKECGHIKAISRHLEIL